MKCFTTTSGCRSTLTCHPAFIIMHWSRIFGFFFLTTAFCNRDSGPAQVIALYLLRRFEDDAGIQNHHIAPDCPSPCDFQKFVQYVSSITTEGDPDFRRVDWTKLTDGSLYNVDEAMDELRKIGYGASLKNSLVFPGGTIKNFPDVMARVQVAVSFVKAIRIGKQLPPTGGAYTLMMYYWTAVSNGRRKNQAENMAKDMVKDFDRKFRKTLAIMTTEPISRPHFASYVQIDLPATLDNAKRTLNVPAQDLEDFITDYDKKYAVGKGKGHITAITLLNEFVGCN